MMDKGNPADERIYKILIVDDDKDVLDSMKLILKNSLELKSYIKTTIDSKEAISEIERQEYDVVISDYKMPGMNGIDLLAWIKKIHPRTTRILITGYPSIDVVREAINKANVHYYIEKPWDNDEFRYTMSQAVKREENIEVRKMPESNENGAINGPNLKLEDKTISKKEGSGQNKNIYPKKLIGDVIGVDDAKEALNMLKHFEKKVVGRGTRGPPKQTLMLEFTSITEFNRFSFEIDKMENAKIKDVRIFENKYIISVLVYPSTYHFVS